jgi:hypothetical protein
MRARSLLAYICGMLLSAASAQAQRSSGARDSLPLTPSLLQTAICASVARCGSTARHTSVPLYGVTPVGADMRRTLFLSRRAGSWTAAAAALGHHARAPFDSLLAAGLLAGICPESTIEACGLRGEVAAVQVGIPVRTGQAMVALYVLVASYRTNGTDRCGGSVQDGTLHLQAAGATWRVLRYEPDGVADLVGCPPAADSTVKRP